MPEAGVLSPALGSGIIELFINTVLYGIPSYASWKHKSFPAIILAIYTQ